MPNGRPGDTRFRSTLWSLLLATAAWAIVLAFFKIGGPANAFEALWRAMWCAGFVWVVCWIAKNTRRRVRLHFVIGLALLGTASAGSFCVHYHRLDIEKVSLMDEGAIAKLGPPEALRQTNLFEGWSLFGGCGGAVAGAVWSWYATRPRTGATQDNAVAQRQGAAKSGFDDRHTEFWGLAAFSGVVVAISLPILRSFGWNGWHLWAGVIGCVAITYAMLLLALNVVNLFEWVKRVWRTRPPV